MVGQKPVAHRGPRSDAHQRKRSVLTTLTPPGHSRGRVRAPHRRERANASSWIRQSSLWILRRFQPRTASCASRGSVPGKGSERPLKGRVARGFGATWGGPRASSEPTERRAPSSSSEVARPLVTLLTLNLGCSPSY